MSLQYVIMLTVASGYKTKTFDKINLKGDDRFFPIQTAKHYSVDYIRKIHLIS